MPWLIEEDVFQAMENAPALTAEQLETFMAAEDSGILSTVAERATISVTGVLTGAPNWRAQFFGGGNTTYPQIDAAMAVAEQDPAVSQIDMFMNSPGGEASAAWKHTMDLVAAATKPVRVIVGEMAASAAYGIAAKADEILAKNELSRLGSIGVVLSARIREDVVDVASTNAPNKRPDAATPEGVAAIRAQIDPVENIFIEAIAEGRGTDVKDVKANYGKGGIVLAGEAIERGMIDGFVENSDTKTTTATGGTKTRESSMTLDELKAQHPALFAEAVAVGTTAERDRVEAHLILGESSGDMVTAIGAVKSGDGMTAKLQASYMAAGMKRNDVQARNAEGEEADTGTPDASAADTIKPEAKADAEADAVADMVAADLGGAE